MMNLWHVEFHCEDKNILEPYHLHNMIFFTKKTTSILENVPELSYHKKKRWTNID